MNAAELEAVMRAHAAALGPDAVRYWERHHRRFQHVVARAAAQARARGTGPVLDIGASFQTLMLRRLFPKCRIDTLGFADRRFSPGEPGRHIEYDLNAAVDPATWPKPPEGGYDLILFLEVIEHLYTAPGPVLRCLAGLLRPGGTLLLSTPNALWLKNRIKLLCGRHPFEMIRESRLNPGHFREYTAAELRGEVARAGFEIEDLEQETWYGFTSAKDRVYARVAQWLGGDFRRDQLLVLRRPSVVAAPLVFRAFPPTR